jgi:drug/metabolite transporter (DMT)-like permease
VGGTGASAGLGLISAASWGGSDFAGGLGARRAPALLVAISGHSVSFLILLSLCLGIGLTLPGWNFLLYAAIGGFEGALSLALFYRALAMGGMGLTAALAGLLTALIPVLYSGITDGLPAPLTAVGLALGCAAIWLITRRPSAKNGRRGETVTPPAALWMAACAGLGFGSQLVFFKMAGGGNLLWIMAAARAAGALALAMVLLLLPPKMPWRGFWRIGILAGMLDTVGNFFYMRASQLGRLDAAAVICSLYPAGTILLASLILREHPTRRQWAGMALALAAVAFLSR